MIRMLIASLLLTAVGLLRAEGNPSLLYWMVEQDPASSPVTFTYATISGSQASGPLTLKDASNPSDSSVWTTDAYANGELNPATSMESGYWADVTGLAGSSFLVELYNDQDELVGRSGSIGYEALASYVKSASDQQVATPFSGWGAFSSVPEPTSGLLTLLGVAALALRRKRILA